MERLLNLLQLAAANLVMLGHNGNLLPALANWGYTVPDRRSTSSSENGSNGSQPVIAEPAAI